MPHYHVTPTRNLPRVLREGLEPRLGPRSRQMREESPGVYLFHDAGEMEDALMGWLGECFPEEARLALLRVEVPEGARTLASAGFETCLADPVPPSALEVLHRDLLSVCDLAEVLGTAPSPSSR